MSSPLPSGNALFSIMYQVSSILPIARVAKLHKRFQCFNRLVATYSNSNIWGGGGIRG